MPERLIAHYRVTGNLGAGGMGEVFRATDTRPDLAAHELDVQAVVQGRVRAEGDEISINLELIDGASGEQRWTLKD